ncbi:7087_t:CDS:1, partial [Gigaspora rosea]
QDSVYDAISRFPKYNLQKKECVSEKNMKKKQDKNTNQSLP